MKKITLLALLAIGVLQFAFAQQTPITKANYELPARFTPDKMRAVVFSVSVDPHYLKKSPQFWYMYETPTGKNWYIVDPAKAQKRLLFDPVQMAKQITEIVKDPYDAQHLPINAIRFNDNETGFHFDVNSSVDMTKDELEAFKQEETILEIEPEKKVTQKKKIIHLFYDLATAKVSEVPEYKRPKGNPSWANVSPDGRTVLFSRDYDLYWMTPEDMEKAKKNEKDSTIVEHRITKDGEEFFPWGGRGYSVLNTEVEKKKGKRAGAYAIWSPDSKNFAVVRTDQRKVGDLWVINNTAAPRPTLESYKYHMPGEANAPQSYLYLFNNSDKSYKMLDASAFKDQTIGINMKPQQKKIP